MQARTGRERAAECPRSTNPLRLPRSDPPELFPWPRWSCWRPHRPHGAVAGTGHAEHPAQAAAATLPLQEAAHKVQNLLLDHPVPNGTATTAECPTVPRRQLQCCLSGLHRPPAALAVGDMERYPHPSAHHLSVLAHVQICGRGRLARHHGAPEVWLCTPQVPRSTVPSPSHRYQSNNRHGLTIIIIHAFCSER